MTVLGFQKLVAVTVKNFMLPIQCSKLNRQKFFERGFRFKISENHKISQFFNFIFYRINLRNLPDFHQNLSDNFRIAKKQEIFHDIFSKLVWKSPRFKKSFEG